MCSASMAFAPSRFASISNWWETLGPIPHATRTGASLRAARILLTVSPPQLDLSEQEPPQVLLVNVLAGDSDGFSDLRPGPAGPHRPLDLGVLELVLHLAHPRAGRKPNVRSDARSPN